MRIDAQWAQRGLDAIRSTLDVDGATKRQMIEFLFEEGFWERGKLSWDAAISRFNDCLNPGKPAFFKIGEVWALMLHFERHELFYAMARDLGFELRRIPTEERRQSLLERIAIATEANTAIIAAATAELGRLGVEPPPSQDSPGQNTRFSLVERNDRDEPAKGFF
jgi:hypothetical protein